MHCDTKPTMYFLSFAQVQMYLPYPKCNAALWLIQLYYKQTHLL